MKWQLQAAKAKFSEVVELALTEGPQFVTRHGKDAVVVVSAVDYAAVREPKRSFRDHLLAIPKADLDIARDKEPARDIDL